MTESTLLMTMSDVARLASVKRPVVSTWRRRSANSDAPFPAPVSQQRGQELFDAYEVGAWLTETKRGNNPQALADAAAHVILQRVAHTGESTFYQVSALLALRSALGEPLIRPMADASAGESGRGSRDGSISVSRSTSNEELRNRLLDEADENDPDDELFYREIEGIRSEDLAALAGYVDALVEAAYSEPAAFEKLMADRFKLGLRDFSDTALSADALQLMAQTAITLAGAQAGSSESAAPAFVDATGGAGDVLLGIAAVENDGGDVTVVTPLDDSVTGRLLRRRLLVHRVDRENLAVEDDGSFSASGSVVHVAQLPPTGNAAMRADDVLAAIDQIAVQMDDEQLAVVMGPASVLCDAGVTRAVDDRRSALLRLGRVRAIVRLPQGLLLHKPQQAQTLWVLGAAHENVDLVDRWTMVADLTAVALNSITIGDLVSDLVASLGDRETVRAHAFRFARLVFTRTLLASRGSLVSGARTVAVGASSGGRRLRPDAVGISGGAAIAVRAEQLLEDLNATGGARDAGLKNVRVSTNPAAHAPANVKASAEAIVPPRSTLGQLLTSGQLRYVPGNRLDPTDVINWGADTDGIRLIGPAEVFNEGALGQRRIDRLRFAVVYAAGRVTEPGDVIFCTSPRPQAIVDIEGTSVVEYPARILRIGGAAPHGLISEMLATEICAITAAERAWRQWSVRQVSVAQRGAMTAALDLLTAERARARKRLNELDELAALLAYGAASGSITVSVDHETVDPSSTTMPACDAPKFLPNSTAPTTNVKL